MVSPCAKQQHAADELFRGARKGHVPRDFEGTASLHEDRNLPAPGKCDSNYVPGKLFSPYEGYRGGATALRRCELVQLSHVPRWPRLCAIDALGAGADAEAESRRGEKAEQ
jgi:hypothetical protein